MYYCHTRYYVPKWLRWLNSDNVEYLDTDDFAGINLFVYCGNNPIIAADPDGNKWNWGAVFAAAVAVLSVSAIVVGTVLCLSGAGAVAGAVLIGAGIGGLMGEVSSVIEQSNSNDGINWGQVNWLKAAIVGTVSGTIVGAGKYFKNSVKLMNRFSSNSTVKALGEQSLEAGLSGRGSYINYWMNVMIRQSIYKSGVSALSNGLRFGANYLINHLL